MNLNQWLSEVEQVASELKQVESNFNGQSEQRKRQVCLAVNRLLHQEQALGQILKEYRSYDESSRFSSAKGRKFISEMMNIAARTEQLYRKTSSFLSQCTWLQVNWALLCKRTDKNHHLLDQQDVIDMKKSYENLAQGIAVLGRRLSELATERSQCTVQYLNYTIEHANKEAARTLCQPLGTSPSNALRHPILGELRLLFHHIYLRTYQQLTDSIQFRSVSLTFVDESRGLMQQAKRMLEQNDRQTTPQVRKKTLQTLQSKLQGIAMLEKKLDQLSLGLVKNAPSRVPLRVTKDKIRSANTVLTPHLWEHTGHDKHHSTHHAK